MESDDRTRSRIWNLTDCLIFLINVRKDLIKVLKTSDQIHLSREWKSVSLYFKGRIKAFVLSHIAMLLLGTNRDFPHALGRIVLLTEVTSKDVPVPSESKKSTHVAPSVLSIKVILHGVYRIMHLQFAKSWGSSWYAEYEKSYLALRTFSTFYPNEVLQTKRKKNVELMTEI